MVRNAVPSVVIVTPYLAQANNGNWRTAKRWGDFLRGPCRVILQADWDAKAGHGDADVLIALHARRSAGAVRRFRAAHPTRPIVVCLTGTDLYKDLPAGDADAAASIAAADALVVLQQDALAHLPKAARAKATVVYQSARALAPAAKAASRLRCVMVGHLRPEKDPLTAMAALERVDRALPVGFTHIGEPLDAALGEAASGLARRDPRYRWLGGRPHAATRQAIRRAHLLVHPSVMEGGANVVVEAITAGTPVLASRMSGNVGMLGADYAGYFEVGDAAGLAALVERSCRDRRFLARLERQCARRRARFTPEAERRALRRLVARLLRAAA
jgi:putative glycosyltransferase (TIGR04348 family)